MLLVLFQKRWRASEHLTESMRHTPLPREREGEGAGKEQEQHEHDRCQELSHTCRHGMIVARHSTSSVPLGTASSSSPLQEDLKEDEDEDEVEDEDYLEEQLPPK